ncbi:hypothetical protein ACFQ1H_00725 [Scardovia wiggsiae]
MEIDFHKADLLSNDVCLPLNIPGGNTTIKHQSGLWYVIWVNGR